MPDSRRLEKIHDKVIYRTLNFELDGSIQVVCFELSKWKKEVGPSREQVAQNSRHIQ